MARPKLILITGGARSGKSRHALDMAASYRDRAFLATAEPVDEEMRERIARHRRERGEGFLTVEAPIDLADALRSLPANVEVAVIDCLTVWLGNLMHRRGTGADRTIPEIEAFLEVLGEPPCDLIVVSNEVGMGIVPDNALARGFRDLAGGLNQDFARIADRLVLVISGTPITVKGAP